LLLPVRVVQALVVVRQVFPDPAGHWLHTEADPEEGPEGVPEDGGENEAEDEGNKVTSVPNAFSDAE
jgi:hypothetical protein